MILAAGLLVLAGLGLFVGGLATGTTSFYWGCVACCAAAAVLLIAVRLRPGTRVAPAAERRAADDRAVAARKATPAGTTAEGKATAGEATAAGAATPAAPAEDDAPTGRHARHAVAPDATDDTAQDTAEDPAPAEGGSGATPATPPAATPPAASPAEPPPVEPPPAAARVASRHAAGPAALDGGDPGEEDVEVTDLLMVVDMRDEVLVVDEHPRYHLAECAWLRGRATIPLPVTEARADGFTPCAVCRPDSHLADLARARKAAKK
ncbi:MULTISPECIES: hypothetical protein [unclassified Blastococcus]